MRTMYRNVLTAYMRYGSRDPQTGAYTTQYSDPVTVTGSLQPIKGGDTLKLNTSGTDYRQASKKLYLRGLPSFQSVAEQDKTDDVLYWDGNRWYEVIQTEDYSTQGAYPTHYKLVLTELPENPPLSPAPLEPL